MSLNLDLGFSEFNLKMEKPAAQRIYEFGEFRLDISHRMLYRGAEEVTLVPKAVETLVALIERRGEIVGKDELLEIVWPDAIVEESNLFLYLSVIRKTLGTQETGKPWVETLRRRGYRFNGEVRAIEAEGEGRIGNGESGTVSVTAPYGSSEPEVRRAEMSMEPLGQSWTSRHVLLAVTTLIALAAILAFMFPYASPRRQINSIAVLPIVNQNGDSDLEYLTEGMPDNLIGSLSKIPNLEVKASSTMSRYKGSDLDAARIGKELNVQAVLSLRFVKRGEDITLLGELVDPATENSLWQKSYNGKTSQLSALQRAILSDVVRELRIDLNDSTRQKLARDYSDNAEATRLYYQGLFHIRRITEPEVRRGITYLWQAIERDPTYAPAYAMIASAHDSLTLCCDVQPTELVEARRAAQRALELDENLAEAHSALAASLYLYDWDFAQAEKHYLRALELNPKSATSHFQYGDFLGRMGRLEEASAERKRAIEIEPLSPLFNAFALYQADPGSAVERARFVIDLDPNFYFSHLMAAGVYARMKMYPEALAAHRRAKELAPDQTWTDVNLSRLLVEMGQVDEARAILDQLLRRSESRYVPPFHIALVYHQLGDVERALAWLEKAYQVHDPKMTFIKTIPFKKHRADPRFQDIYRRVFGS